jgi:hypothetical protein
LKLRIDQVVLFFLVLVIDLRRHTDHRPQSWLSSRIQEGTDVTKETDLGKRIRF